MKPLGKRHVEREFRGRALKNGLNDVCAGAFQPGHKRPAPFGGGHQSGLVKQTDRFVCGDGGGGKLLTNLRLAGQTGLNLSRINPTLQLFRDVEIFISPPGVDFILILPQMKFLIHCRNCTASPH